MPKIIYTDGSGMGRNGTPLNLTPAGLYLETDLDQILSLIEEGRITCGTKRPYPVNWDDDQVPPWEASSTMGPGFYNPNI